MLVISGNDAYSPFQLEKLLGQDGEQVLSAKFVYFIDVKEEDLDKDLERLLHQLLVPSSSSSTVKEGEKQWYVVPRKGSISPWSSKATDILRLLAKNNIGRIERGLMLTTTTGYPFARLFDRMTQRILTELPNDLFDPHHAPSPLRHVEFSNESELKVWGIGEKDASVLISKLKSATDAELMMYAQVNSEHCRHKIFNASIKDGQSMFSWIKATYRKSPKGVLSAYSDNAAVLNGPPGEHLFMVNPASRLYERKEDQVHVVLKVETHNHPTAISPFPGAATGSGGEIRDEGSVGQGSLPLVGVTGFITSNLGLLQHELQVEKPAHLSSALEIMLQAPIGAASYNNEFGRPNIAGFFRTLTLSKSEGDKEWWGYHKPLMLAGGVGIIRDGHIHKQPLPVGTRVLVLGGPGMLIGLGGGAASSAATGTGDAELDFCSVQRDNAEMERRCQQVLLACIAMGERTPILAVHDVGAGGLSNAVPELVHEAGRGVRVDLEAVACADHGMSPMERWCNESQERYVLAVLEERLEELAKLAERERCPLQVIGTVTEQQKCLVEFRGETVVDIDFSVLFSYSPLSFNLSPVPSLTSNDKSNKKSYEFSTLKDTLEKVLQLPSVSNKMFLITIGDRSVTGMVARDQLVGPRQVPVADVGVTCLSYGSVKGEAIALGERPILAIWDAKASVEMALGEALTNLAAAWIPPTTDSIRLSGNWMSAAAVDNEERAKLYQGVCAFSEICQALDIAVPVGKDSLSMKTSSPNTRVISPLTLAVTAVANVENVLKTWTPVLRSDGGGGALVLIDLAKGHCRMRGSALWQVSENEAGEEGECPRVVCTDLLGKFVAFTNKLHGQHGLVQAYHDRSDGGLIVTLAEMAFAGRVGINVNIPCDHKDALSWLFNEELGAVVQVSDLEQLYRVADEVKFPRSCLYEIASVNTDSFKMAISTNDDTNNGKEDVDLAKLLKTWSLLSLKMQQLRDNPQCAQEEFDDLSLLHQGLYVDYPTLDDIPACIYDETRPRVAILREQGTNGHMEMAYAFYRAGFEAVDVHMSDLLGGSKILEDCVGLAACGGFSYGDVLGAAKGWASCILEKPAVRAQFQGFFGRKDTFALGVCNGCQLFSQLTELLKGEKWPRFLKNRSEQFEARWSLVRIKASNNIFLQGMDGCVLPVVVSHGEGRAVGSGEMMVMQYLDPHTKEPAIRYPHNPNGSENAVAGVSSLDGRMLAMMPHPERCVLATQWTPFEWTTGEETPWFRLFINARRWVSGVC